MIKLLEINCPVDKDVSVYSLCSAFQEKHGQNYSFPGELHPSWEILFVIDGTVFVSGDNRIYKLEKNGIIFHKPMEFHAVSTDNSSCHIFVITFYASGKMMKNFENTVTYLDDKSLRFMNYIIDEYRLFTNDSNGYRNFSQHLHDKEFMHTIANYMELMFINIKNNPPDVKIYSYDNKDYETYKKITTFLVDNISKNLTTEEMAKELCMSVSTLKRKFSEFSTMGIHKYFLRLKLTEAADLMRDCGLSISEVCEKLGFRDPNYFSFVFKREYGIPPSEYVKDLMLYSKERFRI